MTVRMTQVKALCTDSELALVKSSRNPELRRLTLAQTKQFSQRARKLFDKWQGQSRSQSRAQSRQVGFPDQETNTQLKAQIFEEALAAFESQREKLSAAAEGEVAKKAAAKSKKLRAVEHRAARASVRATLSQQAADLNTKSLARKAAKKAARTSAAKVTEALPETVEAAPATQTKTKRAGAKVVKRQPAETPTKKSSKAQRPIPTPATKTLQKKQTAETNAKQARVARSGLTTRVRGHVSARGKRAQARRDNKS